MQVHLTLKSSNGKVGPIPVSTTSADSCPPSCPLQTGGCYAMSGPLLLHWRHVTEQRRGTGWVDFCDSISKLPEQQLWRHNQAGDLPGSDDVIDRELLDQLVKANKNRRGFTYTHYPMTSQHNLDCVQSANQEGFTVNLSANTLQEADQLLDSTGLPVVVLMSLSTEWANGKSCLTPQGRTVVRCPVEYRDTSCMDCGMCAHNDREFVVGFTVHGSKKRQANVIASA